jgi:hypothetical protein
MRSDSSEADRELSALAMKLTTFRKDFSTQALSNVLVGLQGIIWISSTPDFASIMTFLNRQVGMTVESFSRSTEGSKKQFKGSKISTKDLVTLCQSLTLFLPETSIFHDMKEYKNLHILNASIMEELISRRRKGDAYHKPLETQSKIKERVHKIAKKRFEDTGVEVRSNVQLFHLFESNVIILIPSDGDRSDTTINVEVNDVDHKNERKRTFCERKDKYLKSKGVFVLRMDASRMNEIEDIELVEWIMSGLESIGSELST